MHTTCVHVPNITYLITRNVRREFNFVLCSLLRKSANLSSTKILTCTTWQYCMSKPQTFKFAHFTFEHKAQYCNLRKNSGYTIVRLCQIGLMYTYTHAYMCVKECLQEHPLVHYMHAFLYIEHV